MSTNAPEPHEGLRSRVRALVLGSALSVGALHAQDWMLEQYTTDDGLPQNSVISIAMDTDGYAWVITEGGLVRFDGHLLQRVPLPIPDNEPQRLRDIIDIRDGSFVVRDTRCRRFVLRNGLVSTSGAKALSGQLYDRCRGVVPGPSAYAFAVKGWHNRQIFFLEAPVVTMMALSDHEWMATDAMGLMHMHDTTVVGSVPRRSLQDRYFNIDDHVFGFDSANVPFRVDLRTHTTSRIVLSGLDPRAVRYPGQFMNPSWRTNDRFPCVRVGNDLYTLARSAHDDTLFATPLHLPLPPDLLIESIYADLDQGLVLIGSTTQGLFVCHRSIARTVRNTIDEPGYNSVFYTQARWSEDEVLTMAGVKACIIGPSGSRRASPPLDRFGRNSVVRDRDGRFWFSVDSLIIRYDPRTSKQWSTPVDRKSHSFAFCYWEEGDSMWVGSNTGIGYVKNDRYVRVFTRTDSSDAGTPISLRRGPDGLLWAATCTGAFRLDTRKGTGAKLVRGTEGLCVRALQPIGRRMFLGTYGEGAWVFDGDTLRRLPGDRMGHLDHVHAILPDGKGFLWLSTNHGLFRARLGEIEGYLQGATSSVFYAYYGRLAGIQNTEFNGGCDPPYMRLGDGVVSFPSLDGFVRIKPEEVPDAFPTAAVLIDEVQVDGKVTDTSALELDPDHHELIVRYALAYWGDPANVQLVYRLDGVQDDWYPLPADKREVRFQHIPHGAHTLTIHKVGSWGRAGQHDTVLHFTVRKPYYMAGWFLVLCGGGVALLCVLVLRVYQARLRKQNLVLARLVRSHTQELRQANERLERSVAVKERLVSIISQDIVMPLRSIARVAHRPGPSGQTPKPELAGKLHDIALSSDKLYMNARNLLNWIKHQGGRIDLRPLHVAMAVLVDETLGPMRELATNRGCELVNQVPLDDVVLTDPHLLGIVLQNLLNNALSLGPRERIVISGAQHDDAYHLIVTEERAGHLPHATSTIEQLPRNGSSDGHVANDVLGMGFVIITELLELLGGRSTVSSDNGQGSRMTIVLPPLTDARARA